MAENEKEVGLSAYQVLRLKFPENEYVLIKEVSDASGFSRSRSLDYMLINLWESRGLSITGIEKKTNRGDWLKELKNPAKQENHFKYCDYFYLLTDKEGVAKLEEIPESWGWYHINEKQILKKMKDAPKLQAQNVSRSFLCAMLRRAAAKDNFIHTDDIESLVKLRCEKAVQAAYHESKYKASQYDELKKRVDAFEADSGLHIRDSWSGNKIGKVVNTYINNGFDNYLSQLKRIKESVDRMAASISENIETIESTNQ